MMLKLVICMICVCSVCGFRTGPLHRLQSLPTTTSRRAIATSIDVADIAKPLAPLQDMSGVSYSTLQGKALQSKTFPSLAEVKSIMPEGTYDKSTPLSLQFAAMDIVFSVIPAFLGIKYVLPQIFSMWASGQFASQALATVLFLLYSVVTGTCTMGMWVTAHECGHGAFSDNKKLQDFVGYLFHSFLLVPYFSWQRSHAVHHANTNNIVDGETHVPPVNVNDSNDNDKKAFTNVMGNSLGEKVYGSVQLFFHLVFGWPAYLFFGATGGPSRGMTNHFFPYQTQRPGSEFPKLKELFPGSWKGKVWQSDVGVVAMLACLGLLANKFGLAWVAAAYGGPYLVVNAWLVLYTWLQHTDVDIPHLPSANFTFMKGAFHTVDRPYDKLLFGAVDFMHHHIGSTHGKLHE